MRLDSQKFQTSQRLAQASTGPQIKKTSIGSSIPVSPPVSLPQPKKTAANTFHKTEPVVDDFEIVEHVGADEDFDVVSYEGRSASNGAAQFDDSLCKGWKEVGRRL
jgi:hypothetical protein